MNGSSNRNINNKALRKQISDAFNAVSLDVFLHDYFPEVRAELTPGMSKSQWITLLLEQSSKQPDKLLEALRRERPHIDWSSLFEAHTPTLPVIASQSASRLLYLGGALSFLLVAVAFVVMNGRLPSNSAPDSFAEQSTAGDDRSETAAAAPVSEADPNQSCPPKLDEDGAPQLLDLPSKDVLAFMPPSSDTWPANPSLVHPVKRHVYRDTLRIGDSVSDIMPGKYPDQCLIHSYILESNYDGLISLTLSENGFRGQGILIVNTTSKELGRDQTIDGAVTLIVPVAADKRYLIEVMNWNFDGGEYELSVSRAE